MKAIIINEADRSNKFPQLFGEEVFRQSPLFIYAENLFYSGMSQMISSYQGGYYDFIQIAEADVEIESTGFIPLLSDNEKVTIENHFGTSANLSAKAASLVVWIYVIEQIAHNVGGHVMQRIFKTIQDIKYSYESLLDEKGNKLFSDEDCHAIYRLID